MPDTSSRSAVELVPNAAADRAAPWTPAQDAILSDSGLAAARAAISAWPGYTETPLLALPGLAVATGVGEIRYKDEAGRFGLGSFKALGGAYAVERLVRKAGSAAGLTVCCATDGNHGRSVAWGARMFGARAVIFIHATVSEGRRRAIEAYGAEVIRTAGNYDDSVREAETTAAKQGWQVVSDTSYPGYMEVPKDVMQGYETMAAEAFDRLDAPPTQIFLQTGVGGMAAAVAGLAKRRWRAARPTIVLADPVRAACWAESMRAGAPVAVAGDIDTMMAGLACGEVSLLAWEILKDHADAVVTVEDAAAADMMRLLARPASGDPPVVAGESAVAGLCALRSAMADDGMRRALGLGSESRVLVFGTEGATDPDLYRQIVDPEAGSPRP